MNKLFTIDKKPLLFNLIGFDHREFFELARQIEENGGKVSLPDKFNPLGIKIVNPNTCYSVKYIKDTIDNSSLVDLKNYCLNNFLENVTETNKNNNSIADDLSVTTSTPGNFDEETDEEHQSHGLFAEDNCLGESPNLLNVENDVADEETDEESQRNSIVMSDQIIDEEMDGRRSHLLVTKAILEKVSKNIDNDLTIDINSPIITSQSDTEDDFVPNSEDDTIKKCKRNKNKKRLRNNRADLSSDESSDDRMLKRLKETSNSSDSSSHLRKTKKKKKQTHLPTVSSTSDVSPKPKQSSEKTVVMKNLIGRPCTPYTSDEESIKINHTNKVSPKKHSPRKNGLASNVHTKTSQPKGIVNENLIEILHDDSEVNNFLNEENERQKATSATKTKLGVRKERFQKLKSITNTRHAADSDDNSNSSSIDPIVASHAKWLEDHKSVEAKIMNNLPRNLYHHYQAWEEQGMIWWLIKNNKIDEAAQPATWRQLIDSGCLSHRTWKGLYNHFNRRLIDKLSSFKLPDDIYRRLNI